MFQGSNVKDQDWQVALFSELPSTPATPEASSISDTYGCFPGHTVEGGDVEQAYLSATLGGPPVYAMLPKELWTKDMYKMRCPVVRLERALYDHRHSGVYWQRYCYTQCLKAGFEPISVDNWPGVYFDKTHGLLPIVYVDDMKMSGPAKNFPQSSKKLGQNAPS